jgi:hypothetical protein
VIHEEEKNTLGETVIGHFKDSAEEAKLGLYQDSIMTQPTELALEAAFRVGWKARGGEDATQDRKEELCQFSEGIFELGGLIWAPEGSAPYRNSGADIWEDIHIQDS